MITLALKVDSTINQIMVISSILKKIPTKSHIIVGTDTDMISIIYRAVWNVDITSFNDCGYKVFTKKELCNHITKGQNFF